MKKFLVLCAALAICLIPAFASADQISYNTTTPIPSTLTDWTGTLSFPQFNPALGTLNFVQLQLAADMSTVLTITNLATEGSSGVAKTEMTVSVQNAGSTLAQPAINMSTTNYSYSLLAGESISSGDITASSSSNDFYTASAILAEFTGLGAIVLDASTFTETWLNNTGGNTAAAQVTDAALTGTVTYNYTVPEPMTMVLLGLGGLGVLRRRVKA